MGRAAHVRGKAHVFVDDVDEPVVQSDDRHHLEHVLRLRPGEDVTVSDGAGAWRRCEWRPGCLLELRDEVEHEPLPAPALVVGFAITKGERPEWIVQKLTEVGVDRIVPFVAARSIVRWDDGKAAGHVRRWRIVARQAAMQSRRAWLPAVDDIRPLDSALVALGQDQGDAGIALAELGGAPPSLQRPAILVGPEGGWDPAELDTGLPTVGLGPTILRAETAAVAAGVLLAGLRAGTVGTIRGLDNPTL